MAATQAKHRITQNNRLPMVRNLDVAASIPIYEGMLIEVTPGTGVIKESDGSGRFVGIAIHDYPSQAAETTNQPIAVELGIVERLDFPAAAAENVGGHAEVVDSNTIALGAGAADNNRIGPVIGWGPGYLDVYCEGPVQ